MDKGIILGHESKISKEVGNLQVVEEGWNVCSRQTVARQHKSNGTWSDIVNRVLLGAFLSTMLK